MQLNIIPSEYPVKLYCGTSWGGGGGGVICYETDFPLMVQMAYRDVKH
jgi:hypothetical protein